MDVHPLCSVGTERCFQFSSRVKKTPKSSNSEHTRQTVGKPGALQAREASWKGRVWERRGSHIGSRLPMRFTSSSSNRIEGSNICLIQYTVSMMNVWELVNLIDHMNGGIIQNNRLLWEEQQDLLFIYARMTRGKSPWAKCNNGWGGWREFLGQALMGTLIRIIDECIFTKQYIYIHTNYYYRLM